MTRSTAAVLATGLDTILQTWAGRGGERDPFYWMLRIERARADGDEGEVLAQVPPAFAADVRRRHADIVAYWHNVRYALLDPLAAVWGTVVNALRVAAGVDSVTPEQARAFTVPIESLTSFVRSARDAGGVTDDLYDVFRPMPAPDCQALAALFHPSATVDVRTLVGLTRMLSAEGPLTAAEAEALSLLAASGLAQFAFQGARRGG
jgi:hypothetical protein